jgi:hypothetical protein
MKPLSKLSPLRLIGAAALLFIFFPVVVAMSRPEELVGLNQPVRYDDFAFSVLGARREKAVGEGRYQRVASGVYVIVRMKIDNQAKRVSYRFQKGAPVVLDDQGAEYQVDPDAQAALDGQRNPVLTWPVTIPAGQAFEVDLVFDVPQDRRDLRLRMGQGRVGVFLDNLFSGRKRFRIP